MGWAAQVPHIVYAALLLMVKECVPAPTTPSSPPPPPDALDAAVFALMVVLLIYGAVTSGEGAVIVGWFILAGAGVLLAATIPLVIIWGRSKKRDR